MALCTSASASFSFFGRSGQIFSGLRLLGFNVSVGIGDGSSTLDLEAIYDPCFSSYATRPRAGTTAYFTASSGFYFNGIINSVSFVDGPNGKIFKCKLIDPKKLIENVHVLLKDYYCPIQITNFINFNHLREGRSAICPPGIDTQNFPRVGNCGVFGTSGPGTSSSKNGISLLKVLQTIDNTTVFTTAGEPLRLNLGMLRNVLSLRAPWSKSDSTSMSLGAIVAQAAEDSGCDYVVSLERGGFIVVWPINRSTNITSNPIDAMASYYKRSGTLINYENGEQELYEMSNRIVLGDKVSYISEINLNTNYHRPSMMLGYDINGNPVRATGNNFRVSINTSTLQALVPGVSSMTPISEQEILCAKTQELWMLFGLATPNSLSGILLNALGISSDPNFRQILISFQQILRNPAAIVGGDVRTAATDALKGVNQLAAKRRNFLKYVQCWKWFNEFINTYYGRKWLVPLKNFCVNPGNIAQVIKGDSGLFQISDVPSDSGYPSPSQFSTGSILGLQRGLPQFVTTDGKYSGFVAVNLAKRTRTTITSQPVIYEVSVEGLSGDSVVENGGLYNKLSHSSELYSNYGKPELLVTTDLIPMEPSIPNAGKNIVNKGLMAMVALFGQSILTVPDTAIGYASVSNVNMFQLHSLAARPDFAAIPMKSNMYVYGPWIGSASGGPSAGVISLAGGIGGTEVVVDNQLNPWNYGSYGAMNVAGTYISRMGVRLFNKDYSGSLRIAEPPGASMQSFIQNYAIIVSSINVTYGTNGAVTEVSFKSHAPKYGQSGKAIADLILADEKARSDTLQGLQDLRRKSIADKYALYGNLLKEMNKVPEFKNPIVDNPTPYFIMVGGYRGSPSASQNNNLSGGSSFSPIGSKDELSCAELCEPGNYDQPAQEPPNGGPSIDRVAEVELEKSNNPEFSYDGEAYMTRGIMSLDGLFAPVSTEGRSNRLSRYFDSYNKFDRISKPRPPMPPLVDKNEIFTINQRYLNPIVSRAVLQSWDGRGVSSKGFFIRYISFSDSVDKLHIENEKQSSTDFGFFALKGPLVLQSWGYDTEGKPIPNIVDSPADTERGIFKNDGTKNKFMSNWLENQKSWPVGPIDLRFDRSRGVWVSPPQERIVVAELTEALGAYECADAALLNPSSQDGLFYENYAIYGPNGENLGQNISSNKIKVCDFLGRHLCAGTKIYAYYNDDKYIVLEASLVDGEHLLSWPEDREKKGPLANETTCPEDECNCESSSPEPDTCEGDDICGLKHCLEELKSSTELTGAGVLGLTEDGCLTLYPVTECPDDEEQTP